VWQSEKKNRKNKEKKNRKNKEYGREEEVR
jgi:hypothetical protein